MSVAILSERIPGWRILAAVLMLAPLVLGPGHALAGKPLTPKQFGTRYMKIVKKRYPKIRIKRFDALGFSFGGPPAKGSKAHLDNAYREYLSAPENLNQVLNTYIRVLGDLNKNASEKYKTRERIVPIVRSAAYLAMIRQAIRKVPRKARSKALFDTIAPGLHLVYAFDLPRAVQPMFERDLERLGMSRTALRKQATKNFRRLIDNKVRIDRGPGVYAVRVDGMYEASLLSLSPKWYRHRFPVNGDLIAYVPARNFIIFSGTEEPRGKSVAQRFAQDVFRKAPRPVFNKPLVLRNGKWRLWKGR